MSDRKGQKILKEKPVIPVINDLRPSGYYLVAGYLAHQGKELVAVLILLQDGHAIERPWRHQ